MVQRWKFKKKYVFPPPQLIQYKCTWQSRSEWCNRYDVSKTRPSIGSFTKYLWLLFRERNLSLATLKVHRSAIATIVDPLSRTLLSQYHMVSRFLEAFFLSRPPRRIVKFIWCVAAVLDMLR